MDDNPDVKEAIRTFVRNQLQGNETLNTNPHGDLEDVINLIAKRAKGIWAACQVDIIIRSSLCDMESISQMLEKIPPDIFGTYEHMITKLLPNVAHYTVKEYLFDKATALGPVKEFALSTEAIQSLELQVIFSGLQQFGTNRPMDAKYPTRYEEYCLKMTDKALKDRRDLIIRDKTIWKTVTECLKWNKPRVPETSVLVSLVLLQWPELARVYLADLPESTKREIWTDKFELARSFRVDGTNPTSLMQLCVTRRDVAFLQALIDSRADFSGEHDLVMDLFYHAYGHRSLDDEDGGAKTGRMLKMLLERGVRPDAPGYVFTPLQFAVGNLEDRWVYDLLYEGADPNAVGSADGVHPFGAGHDIMGHLPPLEICKVTKPEWLQSEGDAELMEVARQRVESSLRRWGAEDPIVRPIVIPADDDDE
ncbi:hypothetical protein UCDDA912_g06860 [Diaporthe ampelina]|uniref:Ankyrin repeat protein n=1 Tax=Diaporthe ampelina TaxID=1214573 RepID=A0A0G2HZ28_9PEZI|nr:hypothetical protein UCDDA912_g06860 [Diaporthe ampelina]